MDSIEAEFHIRPCDAIRLMRIDAFAAERPRLYRQSVIIAGLLGYLFIGIVIVLLLGAMIVLLVQPNIVTMLFGGFMLFSTATTFWLLRRAHSDDGIGGFKVNQDSAPELLSAVARVGKACGVRIHSLRLTGEMNASILRYRSRFGFRRHTLSIGLPLLLALPTDEIEAVIAHEIGHFGGRHGKSTNLIRRLRGRWAILASDGPGLLRIWPLRPLFACYERWFGFYSLALMRNHQFEADRISARVAGATVAGNAHKRVLVQSSRFVDAWSAIWDEAAVNPLPPASPYRRVATALTGQDVRDRSVLDRELARSDDVIGTHPSLARRLSALGQSSDMPPPLDRPAAFDLLGAALEPWFDRLDGDWHTTFETEWPERTAHHKAMSARLAVLNEQIGVGTGSQGDLLERAGLIEVIEGPEAGVRAYSDLLQRYPDTVQATYSVGVLLLEQKDETGIKALMDVSERAPGARASALAEIIAYLMSEGRWEEADRYDRMLRRNRI